MRDPVLGEPWPINDGEFGMGVGQGAGLAHASSRGPRREKGAYSARTGQGLFLMPPMPCPASHVDGGRWNGLGLTMLGVDTNSGLQAVHLIPLDPIQYIQARSYTASTASSHSDPI
jgi:hypothetical protein